MQVPAKHSVYCKHQATTFMVHTYIVKEATRELSKEGNAQAMFRQLAACLKIKVDKRHSWQRALDALTVEQVCDLLDGLADLRAAHH